MGEFLDAFKAGRQAKQTAEQKRIEIDQLENAVAQRAKQNATDAAQEWVKTVLGPVAIEVHDDLSSVGDVEMFDVSKPPLVARTVRIALTGRAPTILTFQVREDGSINFFRDGKLEDTIGSIATISQVQIRARFRETIKSISEA